MIGTIEVDLGKAVLVGENVLAVKQDDGKLILIIDAKETIGLSSTGKMMGIASTGGFQSIPGGLKLNLYVGKKP